METELEFLRDKVEQLESMILFIQAEVHEKLAVILQGFFKHKTANVAEQKRALKLEENLYLKFLDGCTSAVDNCLRLKNGSGSGPGPGRTKVKVRSATTATPVPVTPKSNSRTSASGSTYHKYQRLVRDKNSAPSSGQSGGGGGRKYVSNSDQDSSNDGYENENEADQIGINNLPVLKNPEDPLKSGSGRIEMGMMDMEDGGYNEIKIEIPDQDDDEDDDELENQSMDLDSTDQRVVDSTRKKRTISMCGRKHDPIWQEFTYQKNGKGKCNYCQKEISGRPVRLKCHASTCQETLSRIRKPV